MTAIGCAGHQTLSPSTRDAVRAALAAELARHDPATLIGVSNLAVGTDHLFARSVLAAGGRLHAIIPCEDYVSTFTSPEDRAEFAGLLASSEERVQLAFAEPTEEAFMAGGRAVVDACDLLLAVWDGEPAGGVGGTADVVAYAKEESKPVKVMWPTGATRR